MEIHKDSAGNVWEFREFPYKANSDTNELVELTLTVPKISPEQKKALGELRLKSDKFVSQLQKDVVKAIGDYEHQLHQQHPEMKGRTLAEIGITPTLTFEEDSIKIEFK